MRLLGAILAGGQSRRFGSDKAVAMLDGRTLLDHVIERLAPQVEEVVVCGRTHATLRFLADRPSPDLGPLGGLCAALAFAEVEGFDGVLSAGCDLPGLPRDLGDRLVGDEAAVVSNCPIVGFWPAAFARQLDSYLDNGGNRAVHAWASAAHARFVVIEDLENINTVADLASTSVTLNSFQGPR